MGKNSDERYSDQEAQRRTEKALRAAFGTPHKTYEESKVGQGIARAKKSPRSGKVVNKKA